MQGPENGTDGSDQSKSWMCGALGEEKPGPGPTVEGQSVGIAGEEDSCSWGGGGGGGGVESHLLALQS